MNKIERDEHLELPEGVEREAAVAWDDGYAAGLAARGGRVLVVVDGGLVQDTFAEAGIEVTVIDYDAEEAPEDERGMVPQGPDRDGTVYEDAPAYVWRGHQRPWSEINPTVREFVEREE